MLVWVVGLAVLLLPAFGTPLTVRHAMKGQPAGRPGSPDTPGTPAAEDWVYVSATPGGAGPRSVKREQVWIAPDGRASWRTIVEQDVVAIDTHAVIRPDEILRLRSAVRDRTRPRSPLSGQPPVDQWVGPSLTVALGTRTGFDHWSEVETSLPPALVVAARALLDRARPAAPAPPEPGLFWVQSEPLDPMVEAVLDRDHLIVDLPAERTDASDAMRLVATFPFRWIRISIPPVLVQTGIELSLQQPSAAVRIRGAAYQWVLQHSRQP